MFLSQKEFGEIISSLEGDFVFDLKQKGFRYLDCGDFRRVYTRKNIVIKIPIDYDGYLDNYIEAKAWKERNNTVLDFVPAPCRLLSNGALMMVKVSIALNRNDMLPEWATKIERLQVGRHKGRYVAYDYALDVKQRVNWEQKLGIYDSYYQECHLKV